MLKRVLLTGATGTLGRAIIRCFKKDFEVVALSRKDLELSQIERIVPIIQESRPDVILHAAAMTDVDACELESEKAYLVNWIATKMIAEGARSLRKPLFYISTDYVFGEERDSFMEWDTPSPLSVYGRSKYFGEREVLTLVPEHYIVRTSWVFGPHGRNFFSRIEDNLKKRRLRAVSDQKSAPTYAPFLAEALKALLLDPPPPGIYHLPGEEVGTPLEFALEAREVLGLSVPVEAVSWQELNRPAPRPSSSVLINSALKSLTGIEVQGWRKALRDFLKGGKSGES